MVGFEFDFLKGPRTTDKAGRLERQPDSLRSRAWEKLLMGKMQNVLFLRNILYSTRHVLFLINLIGDQK